MSKLESRDPGHRLLTRKERRQAETQDDDVDESNDRPHVPEAATSLKDFAAADPEPRRHTGRWLLLALALAATALFAFPIRFPASIGTFGRIQSAQEWVLVRGVDGQLSASTFNHETGVSEGYHASSFDRNTSVYFVMSPGMVPGRQISRGDTVGIVSSSEMQERLIALNGQLAQAQDLLAVNTTGEKGVVVQAAEQRVEIAQRRAAEQERSFDRSKTLFAQGLLSQGQYESAENSLHAAEDEVLLANSALDEANSGAKPAQVQLIMNNIAALKQEIAALQSRAATHTIVSPITGLVARSTSAEVLLSVADTSRYVAMIPVRLTDVARVSALHNAEVAFRGLSAPLRGHITAMDHQVTSIGTERVVIATAVLERSAAPLVVGLPLRCEILCPPVSAMMIIKQFLFTLVA